MSNQKISAKEAFKALFSAIDNKKKEEDSKKLEFATAMLTETDQSIEAESWEAGNIASLVTDEGMVPLGAGEYQITGEGIAEGTILVIGEDPEGVIQEVREPESEETENKKEEEMSSEKNGVSREEFETLKSEVSEVLNGVKGLTEKFSTEKKEQEESDIEKLKKENEAIKKKLNEFTSQKPKKNVIQKPAESKPERTIPQPTHMSQVQARLKKNIEAIKN